MKKMIFLAIILLAVSSQPKVIYPEGSKFYSEYAGMGTQEIVYRHDV